MKTLILGAGYAGLAVATALTPHPRLDVTLIDQNPDHQYITRLHELAANGTPVTTPIEPLLSTYYGEGVKFRQGKVKRVHLDAREVELASGERLPYDQLVVCMGSETNFYGIPGLAEHAMELKSEDDAKALHEYVQGVFDGNTERPRDIVVGGAGLTGVELVTELAHRFKAMAAESGQAAPKLYLVEAGPTVLPVLEESLRQQTLKVLQGYGIEVLLGHKIMGAEAGAVKVQTPSGEEKRIEAGKIVWTGGIKALDLVSGERLEKGPMGRLVTDPALRLPAYPEVFVIGDMGLSKDTKSGKIVPTTAQHGWQQGDLTAANLMRLAKGEQVQPYYPYTQGELVSLGGKMALGWVALPARMRLAITGIGAFVMKKVSEWRWRQRIG